MRKKCIVISMRQTYQLGRVKETHRGRPEVSFIYENSTARLIQCLPHLMDLQRV